MPDQRRGRDPEMQLEMGFDCVVLRPIVKALQAQAQHGAASLHATSPI